MLTIIRCLTPCLNHFQLPMPMKPGSYVFVRLLAYLLVLFSLLGLCMLQPDFKAIKKRIEDLITRDYLERDKDNANMYKYLA
jgi:hypothetical protein